MDINCDTQHTGIQHNDITLCYAEYRICCADCRYAECHYAECCVANNLILAKRLRLDLHDL